MMIACLTKERPRCWKTLKNIKVDYFLNDNILVTYTANIQSKGAKVDFDDIPTYIPEKPIKYIDQLRTYIRYRNLAYATEKTYIHWALRYIRFHKYRHPCELSTTEIESFLSYLAVTRNVSINTQKVALNHRDQFNSR